MANWRKQLGFEYGFFNVFCHLAILSGYDMQQPTLHAIQNWQLFVVGKINATFYSMPSLLAWYDYN